MEMGELEEPKHESGRHREPPSFVTLVQICLHAFTADLHLFTDVRTLWMGQVENPIELSVCIRYLFTFSPTVSDIFPEFLAGYI